MPTPVHAEYLSVLKEGALLDALFNNKQGSDEKFSFKI